ncbi:Glycerol-3-phosphate acyltransferase [Planctomycetes bacterium Pan216]|uniref:Glycerol-3-phosphate acyltransferase n=1 Tax=Kolteria novifilia TaxID=2527975 RepID=A0A518B6H3_9BACT|nr:Glycerol-3-phosphate acyltransferase [Planctomycetes bacterium Pan216]
MYLFIGQILAYLVGSIPFGYLTAKLWANIDIREHGSQNIGATNVGRVLGFPFFILVFLLDFAKGAVPVAIAYWVRSRFGAETPELIYLPPLVGLATILGHIFPIYLGLRGGKGVATSIGVILVLAPIPAIIGLAMWVILVLATGMVSVGSVGFALAFALAYLLLGNPFSIDQAAMTLFVLIVTVLVLVRHRQNLKRVLAGTEPRIGLPWFRS